jgi:Holliday junction resolvase
LHFVIFLSTFVKLATEQQIQSKLIKQLEKEGYYVIKLSVTNKTGIPDLLAIPSGSDVEFIEVKRPGQKPRPLQVFRIKELNNHGVKATVYDGTAFYNVSEE